MSRIIMNLPSIAKVNDQTNNLIVRGGSPVENAFYIDNIEIPNINHFPTQGASGGPIGMVNVDFLKDVTFYSGGFTSVYGDKLSSIMYMTFREGNREEFDAQLDLNFAGFGGVAEGPLGGNKGSWLFSARRSYLDLVVDVFDVGTSIAPNYGDFQGKLAYDLNAQHKIMILGIWGDDHNNPDRKTASENDMIYYGDQDIYERTTGLNWRALWNKSGYSNTSIAYTSSEFKEDFYETNTALQLVRNRSIDRTVKFRNLNHFKIGKMYTLEFGIDGKHLEVDYDNRYAQYTDALGKAVPPLVLKQSFSANKIGIFLNYRIRPHHRFTATVGLRIDYFSYNNNSSLSPRLAFAYQITDKTILNVSSGIFYQNLPLLLLSQNDHHRHLKDPVAVHYVAGFNHILTATTKLTMEVYQKDYKNFPIDPSQPALFMIDELYYRYGFFFGHERLLDSGKAYSRGVEIMIQKKLARDFYGLASASYFKTQYQDVDGTWRSRVFDNRVIFSFEGGYIPNNKWEFSARWIYAGGTPYTPFDVEASRVNHRAVLDETRINEARYPDYHSLNLRLDRRFHFSNTNLIFYFSVWNAYNRKNIATYFWNDEKQKQDEIYQWLMLPIFGFEYEF